MHAPASDGPLRAAAHAEGKPPTAVLARLLLGPFSDPSRPGTRHTLLAVCPSSKAVTRAALLAAQEAHTPLLYAATLNQVDRDGGYTGWTPGSLRDFVGDEADRLGVEVPVFLGLDHGGPWAKDAHANAELSPDAAMTEAKRSVTACIKAGYDLLHLDPAAGPPGAPSDSLPLDTLVDRTTTLLRHAEATRRESDRPPLAYEVGTDEARGGLQSADRVRTFLRRLHMALDAHGLPSPTFVVGNLGTRLDSDDLDADRARRFVAAAEESGTLVKGHYTDDVAPLSDYPLSGVGGANVGPGLSAVEAKAVRALAGLESRLGHDSRMVDTLRAAVVESGRWTKWLRTDEQGTAFTDLSPDRQRWLVNTGSRYVWTDPDVRAARTALYEHVAPYRDADTFVLWRLKTALLRYMHAFNLVGLADQLAEALPEDPS
ncbi:class II D-tagatose-bisphosphate aldolase, non-catalytic subunit [Salinibacter grassmerensis]|uniref:class II D-tagatose-bisphosphate aldolase, non-catalytic subunit n=1 Tax=Salinibacter grassmerensis TaxID=3040353 RepID=UPI0021E7290A|nr:class II D-tagatose-bisphosphate aldolase, non-catalytic subunit [Salinibacter grassmerensis]